MKIPGFGGGATNANRVDLPPANTPGKTAGNQPGMPDLPGKTGAPDQPGKSPLSFLNNSKVGGPLSFAGNAFGGLTTLASLTGFGGPGGSQNNSQTPGANAPASGSSSPIGGLLGGGMMQKLMMLLGLQQLLGGATNQQQLPQQPSQTHAPSTGAHKSSNPLDQLIQMLQQLLQQILGVGKGQGAGENQGAGQPGGNYSQSPANGQGQSDGAGQQSGGIAGMMKNLMMLMGLSTLLQSLFGGEGQSSQNKTQL